MKTICELPMFRPMLALTVLTIMVLIQWIGPSAAAAGIANKSAGTYLAVRDQEAVILQINKDRNLSLVKSQQFEGGVLDDLFSDTLGSWKKSGKRELTATTADIVFTRQGGTLVGVAAATYVITFEKNFESAMVTCEGAVFPPGVDPFGQDATPIEGSEFDCGEGGLRFKRLP